MESVLVRRLLTDYNSLLAQGEAALEDHSTMVPVLAGLRLRSMKKPPSKITPAMTAKAALERLNERIRTDPAYRAEVEAVEAERQARADALRAAEAPIVEDLRQAGVQVSSVWDVGMSPDNYPSALPVLFHHLKLDYPDRVRESIARSLGVKQAAAEWETLKGEYIAAQTEGFKDGLAVALSKTATHKNEQELVDLIQDPANGESRILLMLGIHRLRTERGKALLESLVADPQLGKEAKLLLKRGRRPWTNPSE